MPITKNAKEPIGTRKKWPSLTVPVGYLKENGAELEAVDFPKLYAIIGTIFGSSGAGKFKLPDTRGGFDRNLDDGAGIDAGRALGVRQSHLTASHTHSAAQSAHSHSLTGPNGSGSGASNSGFNYSSGSTSGNSSDTTNPTTPAVTVYATGGAETRPINDAFLSIIRAY